jgi:hypothetical protein
MPSTTKNRDGLRMTIFTSRGTMPPGRRDVSAKSDLTLALAWKGHRRSPVGARTAPTFSSGIIAPAMYKVTIQATPINESNWAVVAAGTWTPGQQPQLDKTLAAEVLGDLFNVTPSATDKSGRNQIQCGDTLYAVVFRRLRDSPRERT